MPANDNPNLPDQPAEATAPPQPAQAVPGQIIARSEASLREQRAELARMTGELRQLYQATRSQHSQEAIALRREKECLEQTLTEREKELAETRQQAERELAEARQRAEKAEAQLQQMEQVQRQFVEESEAALSEQRAELAHLMTELREVCHVGAAVAGEDEPAGAVQQAPPGESRVEQLQAELTKALERAHAAETRVEELETMSIEIEGLRRQLQQKDSQVNRLELRMRRSASSVVDDAEIAAYEAELAEYHRQLEADRAALNEEIRQLRARNAELAESTRKVELERAREKAQLYGETQIDRAFADLALRQHERARSDREGHLNKLVPILRMRPQSTKGANNGQWTTTSDQ
jgi:DNA repair exonuclease SbcCD ATPase subunit